MVAWSLREGCDACDRDGGSRGRKAVVGDTET